MATQRILLVEELVDQRCILPGPLVLWKAPLNAPTPTPDMDQTVSNYSFYNSPVQIYSNVNYVYKLGVPDRSNIDLWSLL